MSEFPEGWFRNDQSAEDTSPGAEQTVSIARHGPTAAPPGAWPDQPPARSKPGWGGSGGSGSGSRGGGGWRRWTRPKRIMAIIGGLVVLLLVFTVGFYFYLNSQLNRQNVLVDYSGRPAVGSGTNWLITGSDSRQGLTRRQELQYSTGKDIGGHRSDTILVLHIPANGGRPLLISFPRDSYVHIPGYGMNKINAAYSFGGPKLLAETIQDDTGLYINHYMGIGFGGFVNVVNAVGGVRMCLLTGLHDAASGIHLKKGCQTLSGGAALAYVRDRHNFTTQDLQREQDQRLFLSALLKKLTSPGVEFNPFAAIPAASGTVGNLTVDRGTSLFSLLGVAKALSHPETTTVPIASANYSTSAGDAVLWNSQQARQLFRDLQTGQPVPKNLITGSKQA